MESADNPVIEKIIEDPLGDDDIRAYLPNSTIIKYSQLQDYRKLEELLPKPIDYAFLLYEDSPNKGHWVCVCRYGKTVEFFDSYGGAPDTQLKWVPCPIRKGLQQDKTLLTNLFNKSPFDIIYNPVAYQEDYDDINTCGRHCVFRVLNLVKANRGLAQYYDLMESLRREYEEPYDVIVANIIKKT
jgi:hypothetical protein